MTVRHIGSVEKCGFYLVLGKDDTPELWRDGNYEHELLQRATLMPLSCIDQTCWSNSLTKSAARVVDLSTP